MTIIKKVAENSRKYGNRLAVSSEDGDITYYELYNLVCKFATYLKQNGLKEQDTVIIQGMQNTAYVVILLGTLLSGGVVVPVEKKIVANKLAEIKIATNAKFSFTINELQNFTLSYITKMLNDIPFEEHIFPDEDSVSDILYTTGTTGKPEGIIHTNKSHYATIENVLGRLEMPEHNITMITAPLSHSFALRRFYANIVQGSSIIIFDNIMAVDKFFSLIEKYNIKSIVMNPSAISIVLHMEPDRLSKYINQLVYFEFTGSVLKIEIVKNIMKLLPHTKVYNMYGSTEAGIMLGFDYTAHLDKLGSIGTPNVNSDIYILDSEMHIIKGYGKDNIGYLAIKSPIIMKGYLNNDEATKKVIRNGYYITKDIVYRDEEGFYFFLGRESDIISIGGLKISPDEIEDIARTYSEVKDCACVGKKDMLAGEVPILFVEVTEQFNKQYLFDLLAQNLEAFKCPKDILIIDKLPKTFNGKIIRKDLRAKINS